MAFEYPEERLRAQTKVIQRVHESADFRLKLLQAPNEALGEVLGELGITLDPETIVHVVEERENEWWLPIPSPHWGPWMKYNANGGEQEADRGRQRG